VTDMVVKSEGTDAPVIHRFCVRYEVISESRSDDSDPAEDCEAGAGAEAATKD